MELEDLINDIEKSIKGMSFGNKDWDYVNNNGVSKVVSRDENPFLIAPNMHYHGMFYKYIALVSPNNVQRLIDRIREFEHLAESVLNRNRNKY